MLHLRLNFMTFLVGAHGGASWFRT